MTRLTVHEYAGALRPRCRAAKKGVKRAGLKRASLKVAETSPKARLEPGCRAGLKAGLREPCGRGWPVSRSFR